MFTANSALPSAATARASLSYSWAWRSSRFFSNCAALSSACAALLSASAALASAFAELASAAAALASASPSSALSSVPPLAEAGPSPSGREVSWVKEIFFFFFCV